MASAWKPLKLEEIALIADERNVEALDSLSQLDLHVLLATLNRRRVAYEDEEAFSRFYLDVVERWRLLHN